jgi:hypothetical protein
MTRVGERLDGHRLERVVGGNILEDLGRGERGSVLRHNSVNIAVFWKAKVECNLPRHSPTARCVESGNTCRN